MVISPFFEGVRIRPSSTRFDQVRTPSYLPDEPSGFNSQTLRRFHSLLTTVNSLGASPSHGYLLNFPPSTNHAKLAKPNNEPPRIAPAAKNDRGSDCMKFVFRIVKDRLLLLLSFRKSRRAVDNRGSNPRDPDSRLCVRSSSGCKTFSLASLLSSTDSAAVSCPALFARFSGTVQISVD